MNGGEGRRKKKPILISPKLKVELPRAGLFGGASLNAFFREGLAAGENNVQTYMGTKREVKKAFAA